MGTALSFFVILISSVFIYFAGSRFAESSSAIGDYFRIPRDIKGATLDAISSSLPELLVALFSVVFFSKFEVGIGTIAGSAMFNLLVIPGICAFLAPIALKASQKVISRDTFFYFVSIFLLIFALIYFESWGLGIAIGFLFFYLLYVLEMSRNVMDYRKEGKVKTGEKKIFNAFLMLFFTLIIMAVFTFFLTKASIDLSISLGVYPIIIAFTVTAAATSVPDLVVSAVNAKKGQTEDAISNAVGSNTFDILVGLGLPLLIYSLYHGDVAIEFFNIEIIWGLLASAFVVLYFLKDKIISKKEAFVLILMYALFILYVLYLAFFG